MRLQFVGAYAVGVVRKSGANIIEEDVKLACRAAGRTVEKKGAQSAIPWADEVEKKRLPVTTAQILGF